MTRCGWVVTSGRGVPTLDAVAPERGHTGDDCPHGQRATGRGHLSGQIEAGLAGHIHPGMQPTHRWAGEDAPADPGGVRLSGGKWAVRQTGRKGTGSHAPTLGDARSGAEAGRPDLWINCQVDGLLPATAPVVGENCGILGMGQHLWPDGGPVCDPVRTAAPST